jgi:SAM-dependent methyltransferase
VFGKLLNLFRKPVPVRESWAGEPARMETMVEFLNWFDATTSVESTVAKARSDWRSRIAAFEGYADLPKERSLEIGFGGGRLVAQASKDFTEAVGVDIHEAFHRTREFLALQDVQNARLLHRDELPSLTHGSCNFIYSFIVFQHFDTMEEVDFYLDQCARLLAPGGRCHIFFGRTDAGVRVVDAKDFTKRACSLFIEPPLFRERAARFGLKSLEYEDRMRRDITRPEGPDNVSVQARVLLARVAD